MEWLTEEQVRAQVGLSRAELAWFAEQFREQMRWLRESPQGEEPRYKPDVVPMLQGLAAMVGQGATPEQIKSWFGLAATWQELG